MVLPDAIGRQSNTLILPVVEYTGFKLFRLLNLVKAQRSKSSTYKILISDIDGRPCSGARNGHTLIAAENSRAAF